MSLLQELQATQAAFDEIQRRLETLKADPKLKAIQEFEGELRALMGRYNMSLKDVNNILDPSTIKASGAKPQKQRKLRRYTHPETGEVVESYGGVNKVLAEWKEKYGWPTVQSWAVIVQE